jgi:nucleotide-binding universal stress UspA family protein
MGADVIISYDGTANDDDGLTLGKLLTGGDASELALAYVRHAAESDPDQEALAQRDAERRLELGATRLGDPHVARHIVFGASTGEALEKLADAEGASVVVFGSDYRTPPKHAEPPTSAQRLLEVGAVAVGVAAAGLQAEPDGKIGSIAVPSVEEDKTAMQTAEALAAKLGVPVLADNSAAADLIIVGSQQGAPAGRIALSGSARSALDASRGSVLVVPSGKPVQF